MNPSSTAHPLEDEMVAGPDKKQLLVAPVRRGKAINSNSKTPGEIMCQTRFVLCCLYRGKATFPQENHFFPPPEEKSLLLAKQSNDEGRPSLTHTRPTAPPGEGAPWGAAGSARVCLWGRGRGRGRSRPRPAGTGTGRAQPATWLQPGSSQAWATAPGKEQLSGSRRGSFCWG